MTNLPPGATLTQIDDQYGETDEATAILADIEDQLSACREAEQGINDALRSTIAGLDKALADLQASLMAGALPPGALPFE